MKAVRFHATGRPHCLGLEEVPDPKPQQGQFVIRVQAAGVNPVDTKIRAGKFTRFHPVLPATLGRDVSGTIVAAGRGTSGYPVGAEVFGLLDYDRGGYAEMVLASAREIALKPKELKHREAAAIPVAALTAWQGLFEHGKLRPGQTVLIHGGSGGVGHFAVQFAAWCGANVVATCSREAMDFVTELGATKVIDYQATRFEDEVHDLDLVLDLVGGETRELSWPTLKCGGILVSTLPDPIPKGRTDVSGREVVAYASSEQLSKIADLVVNGHAKVMVGHEFSLGDARAAHEHLERNHSRGKTVLIVPTAS